MTGQPSDALTMSEQDDPKRGKSVKATITATTEPDGVHFRQTWNWSDGTPGGKDVIDIPKRKKSELGTWIHFRLKDDTDPSRGLDFTNDVDGPMWVRRGSCPLEDQKCEDPEIPPGKMQRLNKLLKVFDENNDACTLHYRLRFKDGKDRPESFDPDIRNGGRV